MQSFFEIVYGHLYHTLLLQSIWETSVKQLEIHSETGELYFEIHRFRCKDISCKLCGIPQSMKYPSIDPIPRPVPNIITGHYETYEKTPSFCPDGAYRDMDDYQPRRQLDKLFHNGKINLKETEAIDTFCKEFLASKETVLEHIHHRASLQLGKDTRKRDKQRGKDRGGEIINADVIEDEENVQDVLEESESSDDNEDVIESSDDNEDVVMSVLDGESDVDEEVTFVPSLKTVTRHGRIAGSWCKFMKDSESSDSSERSESSDDEDEDEVSDDIESSDSDNTEQVENVKTIVRTRSGRKVTTWQQKYD